MDDMSHSWRGRFFGLMLQGFGLLNLLNKLLYQRILIWVLVKQHHMAVKTVVG